MRITTERVYDCSPEAFRAHRLDESSRRAKQVDGCGAVSFRVPSRDRQGDVVTVRAELVEEPDLSGPVRRGFGAALRCVKRRRWPGSTPTSAIAQRGAAIAADA